MAKILVTGGAGFIGSHLCDHLVGAGHQVIVLDDLSSGKLRNIRQLQGKVRFIHDSVLNLPAYADVLAGVTRVYHLAGLISGYDSLRNPDEYLDVNLRGLLRVIELSKSASDIRIIFASSSTVYGNQLGASCCESDIRIIFASSSTVYGNQLGASCCESDYPAPMTVYALSKCVGEHLLDMYSSMYGFSYVCLRLFNVYGSRQSLDHPYANVTCKF